MRFPPGGVVVLEVLVGDGKLDGQGDLPTVARVLEGVGVKLKILLLQ
jgi:hypothetical protein